MTTPPQSIAGLKDALARIFPSLPRDFGTSGESVFAEAGPTFDSLMRDFASFFARNIDGFSDRELRRLAELVVACTAAPGPLAQAMNNCFAPGQGRVNDRLDPLLSAAREKAGG